MVKRRLKIKRVILVFILLILIAITSISAVFFYELSPANMNGEEVSFEVESGVTANEVFMKLEEAGIIKSAFFMKIYDKIAGGVEIKAGNYVVSPKMDMTDIHKILGGEVIDSRETIQLTFKEGNNVRDLISLLESKTEITESQVKEKLQDKEYLNQLISRYWFLTDEIKDSDIKYSLEGYLFPNTYTIYKNATIEDIFGKMLDETGKKLEEYRSDIESSNYTVHELITLASIVELESANDKDRENISSVFTNRLNDGWSLGSCVSTFYAFDINMGDRDLNLSEINDCSGKYNTRCTSYLGLPVGPIGNPGLGSIKAALKPSETEYYYFLSDKDMNTYFSKTLAEHEAKGRELRANGLWLEY